MNPRRRLHIKKRIHQTAHRRAMQYPNVQTMIDELRLDWTTLSPVGRGDRLRELAGLGCSTRGLGEQLGESGTSVRRHMELAALPSESRDAVNGGASAKKILAKKALVDRQKRRQERVTEDQRTGRFSDRVADIILEFCQGEGKPERTPILAAEFPQFLTLVKSYLPCADNVNRSAAKLGKKFGVCKLFKQTRPTQKADVLWIEYQAEWLADAIIVMAPEGPIRNRALAKAKGRAGELEPKKTPRQIHDSKIRRLEAISKGPPGRPVFRRNGPHSWERWGQRLGIRQLQNVSYVAVY